MWHEISWPELNYDLVHKAAEDLFLLVVSGVVGGANTTFGGVRFVVSF